MSEHNFANVVVPQLNRSTFKRDYNVKSTFDAGYLVPFYVDEVIPGDTFNVSADLFARLSTPVVPVMDNVYIETFFFYVPSRLVWDNFVRMMGERPEPEDTIDYVVPQLAPGADKSFAVQSVADYFGLPVGINNLSVNVMPFRCYNLIWNEWFRDPNLQERAKVFHGDVTETGTYTLDGDDTVYETYPLRRRGKRFDYFTSALPWPQRGESVSIPVGGSAPVVGNGYGIGITTGSTSGTLGVNSITLSSTIGTIRPLGSFSTDGPVAVGSDVSSGDYLTPTKTAIGLSQDADMSGIVADLSEATAIDINSLRQAMMLQQLLERDARGGSGRYKELVLSHFGVAIPDLRLQRPEFLGGSHGMLKFSSVPQTSASNDVTPQGNLAAFATFGDETEGFTKSFDEHGYIIGLVNVRADLSYQQGVERMWNRLTRYDFYWPELAHLGEQEILNKEIYAQGTSDDDGIFGYQERYAEYRYKPSIITGKLRSTVSGSLDVWHLAQNFANLPRLNSEFIQDNPPIARSLAVQDEPQFIFDASVHVNSVRPMPVHGIPGFQSHF